MIHNHRFKNITNKSSVRKFFPGRLRPRWLMTNRKRNCEFRSIKRLFHPVPRYHSVRVNASSAHETHNQPAFVREYALSAHGRSLSLSNHTNTDETDSWNATSYRITTCESLPGQLEGQGLRIYSLIGSCISRSKWGSKCPTDVVIRGSKYIAIFNLFVDCDDYLMQMFALLFSSLVLSPRVPYFDLPYPVIWILSEGTPYLTIVLLLTLPFF